MAQPVGSNLSPPAHSPQCYCPLRSKYDVWTEQRCVQQDDKENEDAVGLAMTNWLQLPPPSTPAHPSHTSVAPLGENPAVAAAAVNRENEMHKQTGIVCVILTVFPRFGLDLGCFSCHQKECNAPSKRCGLLPVPLSHTSPE